jgi:beta-phosphoglucomutase
MTRYQGIVFDMDGVLIDAREWHYEALNSALEPFGYSIPIDDHKSRFDGLPTSMKLKILSDEQKLPFVLHEVISKTKQDRTLRIAAAKCFPNPSHLVLLSRLKSCGVPMSVYTNSIRQTSTFMLTHANIIEKFDFVLTNEDVISPKPSPEGYLKVAKLMQIEPSKLLVVEDGDYGTQAATAAGCGVVQIDSPKELCVELIAGYFPQILESS